MTEQAVTAATWPTPYRMAGEACGVHVRISADNKDVADRMAELLPPGWVDHSDDPAAVDPEQEVANFTLLSKDGIEYILGRDDVLLARSSLDITLHVFDAQLRAYIALNSPDHVFVHAGAVGYRGRAIVIPGKSFSGKTMLVAELVRAGATYYSDEYAALDEQGLVHPYPKPLSIRQGARVGALHPVESIGGTAGSEPLPIGLIVVSQYRNDATWDPRRLTSGEAVLALLANTVPAQERPEETMRALRAAIDDSGAIALEGERGDAAAIVQQLLDSVPG
jgi:serine kinase of HPr protein (carbohydrate metabolism regulator)